MFLLWAQNLQLWRAFTDAKKDKSFKEIQSFLKNYPKWPLEESIIKKGEKYIDQKTPKKIALEWFSKYPPISFEAHDVFVQHLPHDKKINEIRKTWQTLKMSINQQKIWFQKHHKNLNKKSHQRRLDFLCINNQPDCVLALGDLVNHLKSQCKLRHQLLQNDPHMTISKDASRGLTLSYIQYLRRKNNFKDMLPILKKFKKDQNTFSKEWAYERVRLAKELVQQKKYNEAFDVLHKSGLRSSACQNDVLVLKTEIGYHLLHYRKKLIEDYKTIYKHAEHPTTKSFSAFYLGKIHDPSWLKKASHFSTTYFGQKALETLKTKSPGFMKTHEFNTHKNDLIKTLFALGYSDGDLLIKFIEAVVKRDIHDFEKGASFIDAVSHKFGPPYSLWAGFFVQKKFCKVPKLKSLYPTLPSVKNPLNLGLIKQESLYDPNAKSGANAMGYMQLILKTASTFAGHQVTEKEVFKPENNLKWGSAYLQHLLDYYKGCLPLVLVDYNAGGHRVKKWVEAYGDPRKGEISEDKFIALIPFKETKHYVMQVLANKKIYEGG